MMNRPWSLRQYFASKEAASLAEDYLFVIETDHLLLRPPRNRATEASPVRCTKSASLIVGESERREAFVGVADRSLLPAYLLSRRCECEAEQT